MYIAYEISTVHKGMYFLPAIGGMMSDRPVLRQKGNIISVGDNRGVYEGEHADELYAAILAALKAGEQRVFDIPAYIAEREQAAAAEAAEAAEAASAEAEETPEAAQAESGEAEAAAAAEAESATPTKATNGRRRTRTAKSETDKDDA